MKLITAVVRPQDLAVVMRALSAFGLPGMTVTQVAAATRWNRRLQVYRAAVLVADFAPRLRLELLAADEDVADLADVLAGVVARASGHGGDDTLAVWITPVEQAVRVRTGERGASAV